MSNEHTEKRAPLYPVAVAREALEEVDDTRVDDDTAEQVRDVLETLGDVLAGASPSEFTVECTGGGRDE